MIIQNTRSFAKLKPSFFLLPLFVLFVLFLVLYQQGALSVNQYIHIQQDTFLYWNHVLGQYPDLQYNLTQLGDAFVFLSFLSVFVVFYPKLWESLLSSLLVSLVFSSILKKLFAVPRPAAVVDHDQFIIVGKTLSGHNSLPSGHAITIFTILTVLLFYFMPQRLKYKWVWYVTLFSVGLILISTRVGIGAHYPLDVIIGAIVGYMSGLAGMIINQKINLWTWIKDKKYYPFFMVLFLVSAVVMMTKIVHEQLIIYYLSLGTLVFSLYKITHVYVKK